MSRDYFREMIRHLEDKQGKRDFRQVLREHYELIVHSSIGSTSSFTLRLESDYNRPYVYGVQLLVQNIKDAKESMFNRHLCLVKIGMAHNRQSSKERVDRIKNKLNDTFNVRTRNTKAAKEVFRLPVDPCDHRNVFEIEKDTRKKMGIPLCRGLARHLQLSCIDEWVLTTERRLKKLVKKSHGPRCKNSSLFNGLEKYRITDSDVPDRLNRTGKGICFKLEKRNTEYANSDSQYLFSTESFKKSKRELQRQPCMHLSLLQKMETEKIKKINAS